MSIRITQICDGCKKTRVLNVTRSISENEENDGWVRVGSFEHLCKNCIEEALNKNKRK